MKLGDRPTAPESGCGYTVVGGAGECESEAGMNRVWNESGMGRVICRDVTEHRAGA